MIFYFFKLFYFFYFWFLEWEDEKNLLSGWTKGQKKQWPSRISLRHPIFKCARSFFFLSSKKKLFFLFFFSCIFFCCFPCSFLFLELMLQITGSHKRSAWALQAHFCSLIFISCFFVFFFLSPLNSRLFVITNKDNNNKYVFYCFSLKICYTMYF